MGPKHILCDILFGQRYIKMYMTMFFNVATQMNKAKALDDKWDFTTLEIPNSLWGHISLAFLKGVSIATYGYASI